METSSSRCGASPNNQRCDLGKLLYSSWDHSTGQRLIQTCTLKPDAFKSQRWIDDQGSVRDDIQLFIFGFGRRAPSFGCSFLNTIPFSVCPSQHLANRSIHNHSPCSLGLPRTCSMF
ncbi:hypothetical protein EDB19DRAFT_332830 [Suillus lakei]|nr:hypothetical protein EDB19DRAFT_332830 [Suillus lakei]